MFKRWRKKDNEKSEEEKAPSHGTEETSGFICPMCMLAFDSPDALQIHFVMAHAEGDAAAAPTSDFVCPMCNKSFSAPEELQSHFDMEHDPDEDLLMETKAEPVEGAPGDTLVPESTTKIWNEKEGSLLSFDDDLSPRKESDVSLLSSKLKELEDKAQEVLNFQQELNDVNASLKEEKWYSAALKVEVDKITAEKETLQRQCSSLEKEKEQIQKDYEVKLVEEKERNVKGTMAEFGQLKVDLAQSLEAHSSSQSDQLSLAQKASQLELESNTLKSKLEEEQSKRTSCEEEITRLKAQMEDKNKLNENLEAQLLQRPSGSEVVSLQGKISSLQQHITTLQTEKEEEQKEWHTKYSATLQELNNLQIKVKEVEVEKASKIEQMQSLQTALSASTDNRKQAQEQTQEKHQLIINLQHDLNQANVVLKEKTMFIEYLQKQQEEMKEKMNAEISAKEAASQQVRNFQNQLEENQRQLENKETTLKELEVSLSQKGDDVSRLETEHADLMAKIEAGEGAETAINQLNKEKDQLQSRLSEAQSLCQTQIKEHSSKVEEMYQQQNKVEEELAKSKEQCSRLDAMLQESREQLADSAQKTEALKNDLREKTEAFVALEAAKAAENNVLNEQVRTSQETLQEKLVELSALQQQHARIKEDLGSTREAQVQLETKVQSTVMELENKAKKCVQVETELHQKASAFTNLEQKSGDERGSMERQLNETKKSLEDKQKEFTAMQTEFHKYREETSAKTKGLETDREQLRNNLASTKAQLEEKESRLVIIDKELGGVREEKAKQEGQLAMVTQSLQDKTQELDKLSKEYSESKESLQLRLSETDSTYKQEKSELMMTLKSLKEKLEESKEMYAQKLEREKELQEKVNQFSGEISSLQEGMQELGEAHQLKITTMESDYSNKISEKDKQLSEMQVTLEKKDDKLTELQRRIEVLEAELKKECESCRNYESQLCRTQTLLKEENEKVSLFETQLMVLNSELKDFQKQISASEEEISHVKQHAEDTEANLRQTVEQLNEVKNSLETQVLNVDNELKSARASLNSVNSEKESLGTELLRRNDAFNNMRESMEVRIAELVSTAEAERQQKAKELEEAHDKIQLVISQKLEVENKLSSTENKLNKTLEEFEESKEVAKRVQMLLKEETAAMQTKLTNEIRDKEELTEKMEQNEARLNIHIASLTENVAGARTAAEASEQKASDMANKHKGEANRNEALMGEIAVLEATVQSNLDERRKLLERCVNGEEQIEKLKKEMAQQRKQVEDSKSAMMELTQENQNLQVLNNQMSTRRWEEDGDVANCNSCDKGFSITVRKHHCRNCGLIFCNECTAKTATLAASKKPARVCETCYHDVTTGSIKKYQLHPNQGFS